MRIGLLSDLSIQFHLKEILLERGMTAKELAEIIDITEANLSILCSGKAKAVRFSTLDKICKVLSCDVGDILNYKED